MHVIAPPARRSDPTAPRRRATAAWGLGLVLAAIALLGRAAPAAAQDGIGSLSEGVPPIVEHLGNDRVVELTAVNEPGRVVWFNWALAEAMGLELPRDRRLTPELEAELVRQLSWRLLKEGESAQGRRTIRMFADRYGGWGIGHNRGAGRAAFFGKWNLNIKGVGVTPLVSQLTHESHRHGGAPLKEGVQEAVWGEIGRNLFETGSTRIIAVIDTGDHTRWSDGGQERRALIVRAGHQLRPAHLLADQFQRPSNFEALVRMLEATGNLERAADGVVDLEASLKRLAERHARTAAEMFRHRIIHGGLSPGNKSFDGGMLDLGTITSQPRTAPAHVLDITDFNGRVRDDLRFESENEWRVRDLKTFSEIMMEGRGRRGFRFTPFDVEAFYRSAYEGALRHQLLQAAGLKAEAARALERAEPGLVREWAETLRGLGRLSNDVPMNIERERVDRGSVVDIFGALRGLGAAHFEGGLTPDRVMELLAADADRPEDLETARRLAGRLAELSGRVFDRAFETGGEHFEGREGFERSVRSRAAFENAPMETVFRSVMVPRVQGLIDDFERTGNPEALRREIDRLIDQNVRDVDGLLERGRRVRLPDGSLLSGGRDAEGLRFDVRSFDSGERRLRVELPVEGVSTGGVRLPDGRVVDTATAETMTWRFSTDGWASEREVKGRLEAGADGRTAVVFEAPVEPGTVGRLEGAIRVGEAWMNNGGRNFGVGTFAVPDAADLRRLRSAPGQSVDFGPHTTLAARRAERGAARGMTDLLAESTREGERERSGTRATGSTPTPTATTTTATPVEAHHDHPLASEVERATTRIRQAVRDAFPRVHPMSREGHRNLTVNVSPSTEASVTASLSASNPSVTVSAGMLDRLARATDGMSEDQARAFRGRALALLSIDAANRASSMELDVHRAARAAGLFSGEALGQERLRELRTGFERAGLRVPDVTEKLTRPRSGSVSRGSGLLSDDRVQNESLRRIRDRTRTGNRRTRR